MLTARMNIFLTWKLEATSYVTEGRKEEKSVQGSKGSQQR